MHTVMWHGGCGWLRVAAGGCSCIAHGLAERAHSHTGTPHTRARTAARTRARTWQPACTMTTWHASASTAPGSGDGRPRGPLGSASVSSCTSFAWQRVHTRMASAHAAQHRRCGCRRAAPAAAPHARTRGRSTPAAAAAAVIGCDVNRCRAAEQLQRHAASPRPRGCGCGEAEQLLEGSSHAGLATRHTGLCDSGACE
jgi:hypothetical protein